MRIPDQEALKFIDTLDQIQSALGVDDAWFADCLKLSDKKFKGLKEKRFVPNVASVLSLMEHVPVTFENIMKGRIDFEHLSRRFRKSDPKLLPERYTIGAFSKKRTIVNFLYYLEKTYGWHVKDRVLRHFQLTYHAFENPDEAISIRFIVDLSDYLLKTGISEFEIFQIGTFTALTNQRSPIEKELSVHTSARGLYEHFFEGLTPHFDENHHYRLAELSDELCRVIVVPRQKVAEALKTTRVGSELACLSRAGVGASLTHFIGMPFSNVRHPKCIYRGDSACEYQFELPMLKHMKEPGYTAKRPAASRLLS